MTKAELGVQILKEIAAKRDSGYRLSAARFEDIVRDLCGVQDGKHCPGCLEWVALEGFHRNPSGRFGHVRYCKACIPK